MYRRVLRVYVVARSRAPAPTRRPKCSVCGSSMPLRVLPAAQSSRMANSWSGFLRAMGPWKPRKEKEFIMESLEEWGRVPWKESKVNLKEEVR